MEKEVDLVEVMKSFRTFLWLCHKFYGMEDEEVNFSFGSFYEPERGRYITKRGKRGGKVEIAFVRYAVELNEPGRRQEAYRAILHEATHAWEHYIDPDFYEEVSDLLDKPGLYGHPGNILEEPARLAQYGIDVRDVYLKLIHDPRVRESVHAGNYDFLEIVAEQLMALMKAAEADFEGHWVEYLTAYII